MLVSWVITHLFTGRFYQPTYIANIIHLLSTMDIQYPTMYNGMSQRFWTVARMEHVAPTKMIQNCKSHTIKSSFAYLSIYCFFFCYICLQRLISNHYPRRFCSSNLGENQRFFFPKSQKKKLRRNSLGRRDSRSFCRNRPRPRRPTRSLGEGERSVRTRVLGVST